MCQHALCLAHILRELQGVLDNNKKQEWADWFMTLLREMKSVKGDANSPGEGICQRVLQEEIQPAMGCLSI